MTIGLALSGGSATGAFSAGTVEEMVWGPYGVDEEGLRFSVVSGTRTGALLAPLVVIDELGVAVEHYATLETVDTIALRSIPDALRNGSLLDVEPLRDILEILIDQLTADEVIGHPVTQMLLCTVDLQSGNVVYFHTGPPVDPAVDAKYRLIRIDGRDKLISAIMASSVQPIFMKSETGLYRDNNGLEHQFVDGGVREKVPISITIDAGATEVYAVITSPEEEAPKDRMLTSLPDILLRTISLFLEEVLRTDLTAAQTLADELGVKLTVIRPEGVLLENALVFDQGDMERMIEDGRNRAAAALSAAT